MKCLLPLCLAAALAAPPVQAQYLYMDVDGDGSCDGFDFLPIGGGSVDVWIDTTRDGDGFPVTCPTGEDLTISGYQLVLEALAWPGSSATINGWSNARPEFTKSLGEARDGTLFRVGFTSESPATHLAPGQYKLGTVSTTSGDCAWLTFRAGFALNGTVYTTDFFSRCAGLDGDYIERLGEDFFGICQTSVTCDGNPPPPLDSNSTTWGKIKTLYLPK